MNIEIINETFACVRDPLVSFCICSNDSHTSAEYIQQMNNCQFLIEDYAQYEIYYIFYCLALEYWCMLYSTTFICRIMEVRL